MQPEFNQHVQQRRFQLILTAAVFLAAFILGRFLAGRVALPFSNPEGIVGTLTVIQYNPLNNIVRFLLITLFPTAALAALFFIGRRKLASWLFPPPSQVSDEPRAASWRPLAFPMLIITTVLLGLNARSYYSVGEFEPFEEGQPLSAGVSYLSGGIPYRDFLLMHGLYDEPLRVAVSFKLFGPSVGAMRTLQSINKLITFGFLAWFLVRLFRGNAAYVFFVLFVFFWLRPVDQFGVNRAGITQLPSVLIVPRDMALFAFLGTLTFLADKIRRTDSADKRIFWIAAIWSALPGLGYIHSIERGMYLFVAFVILMSACYFLFFRRGPAARPFLAGCAIGFSLPALLFTYLIRGAFAELIRFTALLGSNAVQLQFGNVYPVLDTPFILIGLMMAFSCFWIFRKFFMHWRSENGIAAGLRAFMRNYFMESALLLISMLFYKNALGRTDWVHVGYVLPIPTILFLFIVIRHAFVPLSQSLRVGRFSGLKTAFTALFWISIAVQSVFVLNSVWRNGALSENFPLARDDSHYLPERWKPVVSFLRENLSPEESFYTLSDELSIYYFVGKASPVRFPLLDMVVKDEQYQQDIIADLEAHNVKYVYADTKSYYFAIDGFSNEVRAPLVFDYVRAHFQQHLDIDGQLIFVRKSG